MPVLAPPLTDRPAYRPYRAAVSDLRRLSPGFLRVSLTCPEFETFGTERLDQRIKLVFPLADGSFSPLDAGDWYDQWRALPDHRRNPFRTYTVRTSPRRSVGSTSTSSCTATADRPRPG